jgi:hypothetical protein
LKAEEDDRMSAAPKLVSLFVGIVCALVLLSSLGMIVASTVLVEPPVWVLFGFEVVVAIAMVLGILFARGKYQDGQGLALACVAGTIAVGSFLGWLGAQHHLTMRSGGVVSLTGWLMARLLAAAVLGGLASLLVLSRNPRSWSYMLKAAMAGGPLLLVMAVYALKPAALSSAMNAMPGWLAGMVGTVGAIAAVVLISASVHCLIRAFELGRTE